MASSKQSDRIMQETLLFLLSAHDLVLLEQEGAEFASAVDEIRDLAGRLRTRYASVDEKKLVGRLRKMKVAELLQVARAFTLLFWLLNLAEERRADRLRAKHDGGSFRSLFGRLRRAGLSGEELAKNLKELRATIVLTAHPTEALRWSLRETLDRVDGLLSQREEGRSSDKDRVEREILSEITGLWLSTTLRTRKPTPLDEVRYAIHVLGQVLVHAVPEVTSRMFSEFRAVYGDVPNLDFASIEHATRRSLRVGSWMGGDRDGNPFVTTDITRDAIRSYREAILLHYVSRIQPLIERFTISDRRTKTSSALEESIARDLAELPILVDRVAGRNSSERYRIKLNAIAVRIEATVEAGRSSEGDLSKGCYSDVDGLRADLELIRESLIENGAYRMIEGALAGLLTDLDVFGFDFVSLDIRQNQSKHRQTRSELICPANGPLESLSLSDQRAFLEDVILSKETIPIPASGLSGDAQEVIETLRFVASLPISKIGRSTRDLVISDTENAVPVLELLALCRQVGLVRPHAKAGFESDVNIVPLFESIESLRGAAESMDRLYRSSAYRQQLESRGWRQQIMLGYSDSMKDGGYLAACAALERVQRELAEQAEAEGIRLEFFHGRGGTIARGGGPAHRAILAQPSGTVKGRIKLTEQGEVIASKYGSRNSAAYHLELLLAATLEASIAGGESGKGEGKRKAKEPPSTWRATLVALADGSRIAYRDLVYDTEGFVETFYAMTPIEEISALNLGSRPAKRSDTRAIGNLRAIPWTFSWNQTRILLPSWFGAGSGFAAYCDNHPDGRDQALKRLRTMYRRWPYFRTVIDNLEQVLAKADLHIGARYAEIAKELPGASEIFLRIEKEYQRTLRAIRDVSGERVLLARDPELREALERRTPYLDVLSYLQVELLERKRTGRGLESGNPDEADRVERAIHLTINGIAAGLRNTG